MNTPEVTCTNNGPYVVTHLKKITVKGKNVVAKEKIHLCRCGQSSKKPYCNGAHVTIGFSSKKQKDRKKDQLDSFSGKYITIHDNRGICAHAGVCTSKLESVFQFMKGVTPRIDPNGGEMKKVIDIIKKCPSGAISFTKNDEKLSLDEESSIIHVIPNGPYALRGKFELTNIAPMQGGNPQQKTLCRCGESKNKPFCDGAHWNSEFDK